MVQFSQPKSTFDEPKGKWVHVCSQSVLNSFEGCGRQLQLDRIHGRSMNEAALKSIIAHAGCEAFYQDLDPIEAMRFEKEGQEEEWDMKLTPTAWGDEGGVLAMYRRWEKHVSHMYDPVMVEQNFDVLIHEDDQREIWLQGTMDFATSGNAAGELKIGDWKFSNSWKWATPKTGKPTKLLKDKNLQSACYQLAMELSGWTVQDFTFVVIPPDEKLPIRHLKVERDESYHPRVLETALGYATLMEADNTNSKWPINPQHDYCSDKFCSHWSRCLGSKGLTISVNR